MSQPQNYKNHGRLHPTFHFFLIPIMLANLVESINYCVHHYAQHRHLAPWYIVMSVALFVLTGTTRGYALKVQDRIIRLEERLRIASLVSASELVELESLTMKQYIGLRFASNPELPDLARRAIREKLTEKQIKQAVVSWRADDDRV
jgi:hypothetical protein